LGSLRIREYDADAATIHADVVIVLDHPLLEAFGSSSSPLQGSASVEPFWVP
jgi:hypothetical protein